VPVTMLEIELEPEATVVQASTGDDNAFLFVLAGAGLLGADGERVRAGQVAWLRQMPEAETSEGDNLPTREQPMRALLLAGRPLREPVVARGPFVMNTETQIRDAYADYRDGRLGALSGA
jgi:redox-sensitive bicupin YhaK (pirin superfamily)